MEGELDPLNGIFLDLIDNDSAHQGIPIDNPDTCPLGPSENPEPGNSGSTSSTTEPPKKRTRSAVIKVPHSRLSQYTSSNTKTTKQPQEKELEEELETRKKHRIRSSPSDEPLYSGIPNIASPRRAGHPKVAPTASHPLAGKHRVPDSRSLSVSSGGSNGDMPDDISINTG